MIKGTTQQDDITLANIYAINIGAPKYVEQLLMDIKGETNRNKVIIGDFNTSFTSMDRSSRQNINKETAALNNTLDQIDFIDIFRVFHSKEAEYTFFLSACGMSSRIDHILGHKTSLNKFKIETISGIFFDYNGMKLEINYKK